MSLVALLLVQVAPIVPPASPSSRTLTGRFTCATEAYEVQVTAAPLAGAGVVLDRLLIGGRPIDAGSLAEARRMMARLTDVQSLDVRCRGDAIGELSVYGTQSTPGAPPRRARLRGTLRGSGITALVVGVAQR